MEAHEKKVKSSMGQYGKNNGQQAHLHNKR